MYQMRPPSPRITLAGILFSALLVLTGCGSSSSDEPRDAADEITVDHSRFGDPYEIVTGDSPSEPDIPPGLYSDTLFVQVAYQGGCDDHTFTLHHENEQDTTRFWISHNAPRQDDDCEQYIRDELAFPLSEGQVEHATVTLLNPQGYEPHMLRWGIGR